MADAASLVHGRASLPMALQRLWLGSGRLGRAAGLAQPGDFERDLLRRDVLRREREQHPLVFVTQRNLDDLLALAANGEGGLAVAGAVVAGDEGRAGLQ